MILINFSNQLAAGPKNISLNFIKQALKCKTERFIIIVPQIHEFLQFEDTKNIIFIFVPVGGGLLSKIYKTLRINWIIMPSVVKKYKPESVLAFGNFLLGSFNNAKKTVLLHHPYLVDDDLYNSLNGVKYFSEYLKRLAFTWTVKNVDSVVVQSEYMEKEFLKKYPSSKEKTVLIFNPISDDFISHKDATRVQKRLNSLSDKKVYRILYVSRFYPHKNHNFINKLAKEAKLKGYPLKFLVTIDQKLQGAKECLQDIDKTNIPVINLGEIQQRELVRYYSDADFFIFPSHSETFGNPLIEAMFFSLPTIVPDKAYTRAILGNGASYYTEDDVDSCLETIMKLLSKPQLYFESCAYSYERADLFPDSPKWFGDYFKLIGNGNV